MRPGQRRRRSDKDNIPAGIRKLPSPPTTLEQAQMEWDLVETVQPGKHSTYTCSLPELYLFSSFLLALRTLLVYTTKNRALFQFCEIIETQTELRFGTDFKFLDIFQKEECVFVERFYEKRK